MPLEVLSTEYASVATPLVNYVNQLQDTQHEQIIVLTPTVISDRFRHRILPNQLDLVLSSALRTCPNIVVARVPMATTATNNPPPHPTITTSTSQ